MSFLGHLQLVSIFYFFFSRAIIEVFNLKYYLYHADSIECPVTKAEHLIDTHTYIAKLSA